MQSIDKEKLALLSIFDPALRAVPNEFDFANPQYEPKELVEALGFCIEAFNGLGISANQVGLPVKVFAWKDTETKVHTFFNPSVIMSSKEMVPMKEGCLSLPNVWLTISRPKSCIIEFQTIEGDKKTAEVSGLYARIILHEYDHMIGRNFTMYASKLKLQRAAKAMDKRIQKAADKAVMKHIMEGK